MNVIVGYFPVHYLLFKTFSVVAVMTGVFLLSKHLRQRADPRGLHPVRCDGCERSQCRHDSHRGQSQF